MVRLYTRDNSPYWYAEIEVDGKPRRLSTGVPKNPRLRKQAKEFAEAKCLELSAQLGLSLREAAGKYLRELELRATTIDNYGRNLAVVVASAPTICLRDITVTWLRTYVRGRKGVVSDIKIRHELSVLSSLMEVAVENGWDEKLTINPVKLISKKTLGKSVSRARWLKPHEVQAIFDATPEGIWKSYLLLLLETGMRRDELLGLSWEEVDLVNGSINLPSHREKTKIDKEIPLTNTAWDTLRTLHDERKSDWVFTSPRTGRRYHPSGLNQTWIRIREKAGVPHARLHDFRHSFASWTRQLGMSTDDRRRIMGHSTTESHDLYSRTTMEVLRETLNRFSPSTLLAQSTKTGHPDREKT